MRNTADRLTELQAFLRELEAQPWRHDFYLTLRRFECLHPERPRIGQAVRPAEEPLRLGQEVSLVFAPAPLAAFRPADDTRPARLTQHFFGLLGPNGPLPLHLTEYAHERRLHHGDTTFAAFLDMLQHRLLTLFYRAWAQAEPTVSLDRPHDDRHADFVGSLIGIGRPRLRGRDEAGDAVKLHHAGLLARQVRNADGLQALLSGYFRVAVRVESFVGHWMALPRSQCTRLGRHGASSQLGVGAVAGMRVFDRQHRFRLHMGPLDLAGYEDFLPGGRALPRLLALVRQYLCMELEWDLRLTLRRADQPPLRLGGGTRLGWTTWLGRGGRAAAHDPDDLVLDAEAASRRPPRPPRPTAPA